MSRGFALINICSPIPWEQFVDAVDFVIGDAGENVAEIGFGINGVELAGFDEGVDGSGAIAAPVGSSKEIVLAAKGNAPDGALSGVVVNLDTAIMNEACECLPA